ncbi:MAG: ABC transporter permease [Solirubrobacterales bacterium]
MRAHKLRSLLNALGIVLGVGLIFAVISLSVTLVSTFDNLYASVYGKTDLLVTPPTIDGTVKRSKLAVVQKDPAVKTAAPSITAVLSLVKDGKTKSRQTDQVNTSGVDPTLPDLTGAKVASGRPIRGGRDIAIDEAFAKRHDLKAGDSIRLAGPDGKQLYRVSGILSFGSGVQFGGQGFATMPIARARKAFDVDEGFSQIALRLDRDAEVAAVQKRLERKLGRKVSVKTPSAKGEDAASQLRAFNVILYFFAAMALFVGGYLILNSFNMTVAQRMREIGMMRTIGASQRQIVGMILAEAVLLGLIGCALGLIVGLVLTGLMVSLVQSVNVPIGEVVHPPIAFILAPLIGMIATVLGALRPAIKAGRVPAIRSVVSEHRSAQIDMRRRVIVAAVCMPAGLWGVFKLASSSAIPLGTAIVGIGGIALLLVGVIALAPVVLPPLVGALSWGIRQITPIEGRLAADQSRANPMRSAATASGLMIGVALVAAIGCLGSSLIGSITDQLNKHLLNDFTVQPRDFRQGGIGSRTLISQHTVDRIGKLDGVAVATGVRLLYVPKGFRGADFQAFGFDPHERSRIVKQTYVGVPASTVLRRVQRGQVTIGGQLKRGRKIEAGDTIKLTGSDGTKKLKVAGLLATSSFEDQAIGMSNKQFRDLYGVKGYSQVNIVAKGNSPEARQAVGKRVRKLLADDYPNLDTLSNAAVKNQVKAQTNQIFSIFYVIMLVAIAVSLLGVINTLLISVLERTRETGVLRAVGAGRWQVRRIVGDESVLLTLAGALLGLGVGMAIGYAFVRGVAVGLEGVRFTPPTGLIVLVAFASVVLGIVAAIVPAIKATRMNIIDAISYE